MKGNFLADQSGMMRQLTDLQGLIRKMDFQLFTHLDKTGSLNLFFTYRWILTGQSCARSWSATPHPHPLTPPPRLHQLAGFKRELSFPQTLRLWEVLFTDYYSTHFHLFVGKFFSSLPAAPHRQPVNPRFLAHSARNHRGQPRRHHPLPPRLRRGAQVLQRTQRDARH